LAILALAQAPASTAGIEGRVTGVSDPRRAVVYLLGKGAGRSPDRTEYQLDQRCRAFEPEVLAVPAGARVLFHNSDDFLHNVHARMGARTLFNWGMVADGPPLSFRFVEPGEVRLLCEVHPEMEGWIKVVPTPLFNQPDSRGYYRIEDVPPGAHTLAVWHPRSAVKTAEISVPPLTMVKRDWALSR
jgi:plastocyanin